MKQIIKYIWNNKDPQFESEEQKCDFVIAKYTFAFTVGAVLSWVSWEFADLINTEFPFSPKGILLFQTVSVLMTVIGFFGNPGRKIQTWSGNSKAEQLDEKISNMLALVGCFLSFCSFHLIPLH